MLLSLLFREPYLFFIIILAILYTLSVHEYFHAQMATLLGDDTARHYGRLTLNPLSHIDFIGFMMLLLVGFGWGKPVPFDPLNFKNMRRDTALVAVAGPVANLLSLIFFGLIYKFVTPILGLNNLLPLFLMWLIIYNAVLMVFNLIPIPPLDGSKVLFSILPARFNDFKIALTRQGPLILIGLIFLSNFLGLPIFTGLFRFVINLCQQVFGTFPLTFF